MSYFAACCPSKTVFLPCYIFSTKIMLTTPDIIEIEEVSSPPLPRFGHLSPTPPPTLG